MLAKAEHWETVAAVLDGMDFRGCSLSFDLTQNTNLQSSTMEAKFNKHTTLVIWWYEPSTTLVASYDTVDTAAAHQRDQKAFDSLVETAFRVYMDKNGHKFKYCTIADCKQAYRIGGDVDVQ
ncbi:hypothetical protein BJ165DRAFT_1614163 [Panaeolus papilionaceus]|nr:hypothetical protein BJ165DRAFT_1614163 [Panaeolus papilionaceus]